MPTRSFHRFVSAAMLGLSSIVGAAGTPAGTVITNTAYLDSLPENSDTPLPTVSSAEASTTVLPLCVPDVTPSGTVAAPAQHRTVTSEQTAVLPYRLTNGGNTTFTFDVEGTLDAASQVLLPPGALRVLRDVNGNGVADPEDTGVTDVTLNADAQAALLLEVRTDFTTRGAVYVNLTASCADESRSDTDNVSRIDVNGFSRLTFSKTFSPAHITPNGVSDVTLSVTNTGNEPARNVVVTDLLDTPDLAGLSFVPQSAASGGTLTYSADTTTWGAEGPIVRGVRGTAAELAVNGTLRLTFRLQAHPFATPGTRRNIAAVTADERPAQDAAATLNVLAAPALALGPVGNPLALAGGEGSVDDTQRRDGAALGQAVCFDHTLRNTGNVADQVTLTTAVTAGAASTTLLTADGSPLTQPLTLTPGASVSVRACHTPTLTADLTVVLTATSSVGATLNRTADTVTNLSGATVPLTKTVSPTGTVVRNSRLTYTLTVTNPYPFALHDLRLTDPLDAHLQFVSASNSGTYDASTRSVTWTIGTLAPGARTQVTVTALVTPDTPDDTLIPNHFTVQSVELPTALTSPAVTSPVFTSALTLEKDASARTFTVGDRVTYTISVHNGSPTASLRDLDVTDALPAGLQYLSGTSRAGGAPIADPIRTAAGLTWRLPTLEARSTVKVTFDARVLPGAGQDLVNVAAARALGVNGVVIAANEDRVAVRVTAAPFAPPQDLIGRVFVDLDRDDRYDDGTDTPVARARLLLPNGRTVLTDERGRYHFASVGVDRVAVRLDPASVRWTPRASPGDPDARGTRLVSVRGLTSADFALEPYDGAATALRDTRLTAGPLTLIKTVTREPDAGTYRVRLTLRATETLRGLTLLDPLPVGAALMDGANTLAPQDFTGERTWTYTFHFSGAPEHTTTDPTITWNTRTGGRP